MIPEFSEFTYGYTLIEELSRIHKFSSVPTFPSLREEGTVGGYDAAIKISGLPFFFQFKRSEFFSRANSKYYSLFSSKYYRFHLHALKHSQQHDLLLHLELLGNPVFYVAPIFHTNSALHQNYFRRSIVTNSIWLAPTDIGNLPDNEAHSINYNSSKSIIYLCSNPEEIKQSLSTTTEGFSKFVVGFKEKDNYLQYHSETWEELYYQIKYVADTRTSFDVRLFEEYESNNQDIIDKMVKLARCSIGCEIIIYKNS
jgi:hypothetical protein